MAARRFGVRRRCHNGNAKVGHEMTTTRELRPTETVPYPATAGGEIDRPSTPRWAVPVLEQLDDEDNQTVYGLHHLRADLRLVMRIMEVGTPSNIAAWCEDGDEQLPPWARDALASYRPEDGHFARYRSFSEVQALIKLVGNVLLYPE